MSLVAGEPPIPDPQRAVAVAFREQSGKVVATLARVFRSIDLAEEAVQEAFETAIRIWPERGIPENPAAWITTTARNKALDRVRREAKRFDLEASAQGPALVIDDDPDCRRGDPRRPATPRLHLLPPGAERRGEGGAHPPAPRRVVHPRDRPRFPGQRGDDGKATGPGEAQDRRSRDPVSGSPSAHELPDRLDGVLATLYLAFTAGHVASTGDDLLRLDLCEEAIRLTRVLWGLMPDEPEVGGLLALMLLTHSRRGARVG